MLAKKIVLNDRIRKLIIDYRKSAKERNPLMTADYISEQIGRAKSWLSQVENGRLQSVKTDDLINVFCFLQNRDRNNKKDRKHVEEYLDDQIQYIMITQKHGIIKEDGDIPDFSEMLSFQSARRHLQFAGKNIIEIFYKLSNLSVEEIENDLKKYIKRVFSSIIEWINRAFNDTSELFSDEISTRNLYLIIETSIKIYEGHCDYFGLNHLKISDEKLQELKEKFNTDYFIKAKTIVKPLDEYDKIEINDVIKHFSSEEYMTWKNKQVYIGNDPFPMVVNYITSISSEDNFISYEDVNTATGLTEAEYLYLIKQIYVQFDILYNKYKVLLTDYEDLQDENEDLFNENKELKKINS